MRFLVIWLPVAKSVGDQVYKQTFNHILAKQIDIVFLPDWMLAVGCIKIQNVEKSKNFVVTSPCNLTVSVCSTSQYKNLYSHLIESGIQFC